MMKDIIVIAGFSASGKDSLLNKLVEEGGYSRVISHTSRPIRSNEVDGREYHFVSKEEFLELKDAGEFIEVREYSTLVDNIPDLWYYGATFDSVSGVSKNVVVLDILGMKAFKEHYGDRVVSFFIDADEETRRERCKLRGDYNEVEFNRRLSDDKKCFPPDIVRNEIDYTIRSTNVVENYHEIMSILMGYE